MQQVGARENGQVVPRQSQSRWRGLGGADVFYLSGCGPSHVGVIAIAPATLAVVFVVHLIHVGNDRAVVARIANPVTVGVELIGVAHGLALVDAVDRAGAIRIRDEARTHVDALRRRTRSTPATSTHFALLDSPGTGNSVPWASWEPCRSLPAAAGGGACS